MGAFLPKPASPPMPPYRLPMLHSKSPQTAQPKTTHVVPEPRRGFVGSHTAALRALAWPGFSAEARPGTGPPASNVPAPQLPPPSQQRRVSAGERPTPGSFV